MIPADDKLSMLGEIKYEHLFVDGTKNEANANKYSFVWKKRTTKYETRLHGKLEKLIPEMCAKYGILADTPEDVLHDLELKVAVPFVHGRGKRKSELQKDIELLQGMLNRNNAVYQEKFQDRNSFSKTDPDATLMHMKEDHMRNAQLKPGYNIQLEVEGKYITGVLVSSERSDQLTLIPLMDNMEMWASGRVSLALKGRLLITNVKTAKAARTGKNVPDQRATGHFKFQRSSLSSESSRLSAFPVKKAFCCE